MSTHANVECLENLGKKGRDKVSGYEGTISGLCFYVTGCAQYGLCPPAKDGKLENTHYFDVTRVEILNEKSVLDGAKIVDPGGPSRAVEEGMRK